MDLISLQLRMLQGGCQADRAAVVIHGLGNFECPLIVDVKQVFHHSFDVAVRVIVIVPQHNVVPRLMSWSRGAFRYGIEFNLCIGGGHGEFLPIKNYDVKNDSGETFYSRHPNLIIFNAFLDHD